MAVYDLESLLYEIDSFLKSKLNTEITAVSSEKGDGLTLASIATNAFAVQTMDDKVMNYESFVFTQCIDIATVGAGPTTSKDYSIVVLICSAFNQNQLDQVRRMLRYGRALERVFEKYWDSVNSHKIKFKIKSIPPSDYVDINSSKPYRIVGVELSGGLA